MQFTDNQLFQLLERRIYVNLYQDDIHYKLARKLPAGHTDYRGSDIRAV